MHLDRIFTVLDKPKHEQVAFARAQTLMHATKGKGRPHVAAAFCWHPLAESTRSLGSKDAKSLKTNMIAERKQWLAEMLEDLPSPLPIKPEVIWTPQLADWVADNLTTERFDLVVKSVHRHRQLEPSDTDWELLRHCQLPLLLTASPPVKRRRQILATIDVRHLDRAHQALNFQVLDAAASLANVTGGDIHIGCAVEYSEVLRDLDFTDPKALQKRFESNSRPMLQKLCAPYGIPPEHCHFPLGKAGIAINTLAKQVKAGTVVMGAFPHPGKALLGLPNTAGRIISKANCDVLIVRNPA